MKIINNIFFPFGSKNRLVIIAVFLAVAWSFAQLEQASLINFAGFPLLIKFFSASLHPQLSLDFLSLTVKAIFVTFAYAVCGTFLSLVLGLIIGVFSSKIWWLTVFPHQIGLRNTVWLVCRSILTLPRSLHELIWGLLLVNIWGLDPLTGIIAIAIPYGAIVGKVFSEILDETPSANCLALTNSGVKPWTAFAYSIIPQAYLNLLSYSFYRFECSLRSATVLGIIGAGGLGYQIYLSLQSLRYQELWTLFYALIFLNGLVDVSSNWLRRRLGCVSRLDLYAGKLTSSRKVNINNNFIFLGLNFSWLILVLSCFCYLQPDLTKIWHSQTLNNLQQLFSLAFPPTLSPETMGQLFNLTSQTLAMSILAITLAGIGGIIISFPAANNFSLMGVHHFKKSPLAWLCLITCRLFLLLCRAIPSPIWALIALFVLFPGILPGSLALGIHNLGILGRLMAEVNENLEKAPLQALQAQGTPPASVVIYGVLPLTLNKFIAYILYRWEVCMRETVIVGLVGAGGLGKLLTEQLSSFDYAGVAATLICFIFLTFMVDRISAIVRSQTYL